MHINLPENAKIGSNSLITAFANSGFEVFAGFAVFSTLGYMAFASGVPVGEVAKGGAGLAFITYPKAISLLPVGSSFFGVIFFSALIFAGITSAISIFESFVSSVIDKFGFSRKSVATICSLIGCAGSLIFTTGAGLHWIEIVDYFLNNFGLLMIGLLEAILIAWVLGADKLSQHIERHNPLPAMRIWRLVIRFITPTLIFILLIAEFVRVIKDPYGGYSWLALGSIGVGWVLLTIIAAFTFAKKRWSRNIHAPL